MKHSPTRKAAPAQSSEQEWPAGTSDETDYQQLITENPEIFGKNCLYFSSEEEMLEMYDQLLEFSSEELEDWAREHALSNMALQSNIIYDKVLKEIGESYKYNFEEDTPMPSGLAKHILEKLHIATHWLKTKRPTAYIDIPTLQYEFINEHNLQINR